MAHLKHGTSSHLLSANGHLVADCDCCGGPAGCCPGDGPTSYLISGHMRIYNADEPLVTLAECDFAIIVDGDPATCLYGGLDIDICGYTFDVDLDLSGSDPCSWGMTFTHFEVSGGTNKLAPPTGAWSNITGTGDIADNFTVSNLVVS